MFFFSFIIFFFFAKTTFSHPTTHTDRLFVACPTKKLKYCREKKIIFGNEIPNWMEMYLILRVMRHEVCCSVIYGFFTINYKKAFYSLLISILHIAIIPCNKTQTYSVIRIFFSVFYYFFYYNFFFSYFSDFFFFFEIVIKNRLKLNLTKNSFFSRIFDFFFRAIF